MHTIYTISLANPIILMTLDELPFLNLSFIPTIKNVI